MGATTTAADAGPSPCGVLPPASSTMRITAANTAPSSTRLCCASMDADLDVGKGTCFDNAMVETFRKTLKAERVWRVASHSRAEASGAICRHIDGFDNPVGGIRLAGRSVGAAACLPLSALAFCAD